MELKQFKYLVPGDRTIINDKMETVAKTSFGKGLICVNGNTAMPVIVEFNSGLKLKVHPKDYIEILEGDDGGLPTRNWLVTVVKKHFHRSSHR